MRIHHGAATNGDRRRWQAHDEAVAIGQAPSACRQLQLRPALTGRNQKFVTIQQPGARHALRRAAKDFDFGVVP